MADHKANNPNIVVKITNIMFKYSKTQLKNPFVFFSKYLQK